MKKLCMILPLALILCFMVGCQDKEAMAELEAFKAQAEVEEQNKALMRKSFEAWGKGDFEAFKGLLAPDYAFYYPPNSPNPISREELIEVVKMIFVAFPDYNASIEELFAVGDQVIFRHISRSTHQGDKIGTW